MNKVRRNHSNANGHSRNGNGVLRGHVRLAKHLSTAIFVKDRRHRWVMLNDRCCRLLGHARGVLIGKTDRDFLPKEQANRIWKREERIFASGEEDYDEESVIDGGGVERTYATTKSLFTAAGGAWIIGVITEVTAHKRALEECRFMKSLLEAQNDASIAGILVVDDAGRILTTNRRFRAMWEIPEGVLAFKSDAKALRSVLSKLVDAKSFLSRVDYLYRHPSEKSHDELHLRDGRTFDRYTAPVVGKDGVYYGRVWHFRDITDAQKLAVLNAEVEKSRALDALKKQFIGTLSHELRTPLTVVHAAVDTLRGGSAGALSPKQQEIADLCHRNILRLNKMINNLLDISRLESGTAKARLERLDLRLLLADLETNFRLMERGKEASLVIDAPAAPPPVRGDPEMIAEVLFNLLDNAARYARRTVRVRLRREGDAVRFEVADDGPGIPREQIPRLFNKFSQVERAVGGGYKGTGLGLAICKEIMILHGSKIGVESPPGRGARFHFSLPVWAPRPAAAAPIRGRPREGVRPWAPRRR